MRIEPPSPAEAAQFSIPKGRFYEEMTARMGEFALRQRLSGEELVRNAYHLSFARRNGILQDRTLPVRLLDASLRYSGLARRARQNFQTITVNELDIRLRQPVAPGLDGLRILHISDFHFDFDPAVLSRLESVTADLEYDLVALTGDYNDMVIDKEQVNPVFYQKLGSLFTAPVFAVLGNHDFLWTADLLESNGIRVLMNEGEHLEIKGAGLYIAGVDDPRMYRSCDIESAMKNTPQGTPVVLLAHAPQIYEDAARNGVDLLLCGHTHGGQVCWPNGRPLIHRFRCPSRMISGYWTYKELQGYTSNGCGGCKLPYRLSAPAEVSVLTLHS